MLHGPIVRTFLRYCIPWTLAMLFQSSAAVVDGFFVGRYVGAFKDLGSFGQGYRNALCVGVFPLDDKDQDFVFKPGAYQDGFISLFGRTCPST